MQLMIVSAAITLALVTAACDAGVTTTAPTSTPSVRPAPAAGAADGPLNGPAPPTPTGFGTWPISDRYTPLAVGETIIGRITAEDARCVVDFGEHCRYYRVTSPATGLLEIVLKSDGMETSYVSAPLDLYITNVTDLPGFGWDPVFGPGPQMRVSALVKTGESYQVTVWSSKVPGVNFEIRASVWPD